MIRRYFYIFSATLFILLTPKTAIRAAIEDKQLEALSRLKNSPPDGFNYQAVLRDDDGDVLANRPVAIRFTLNNGAADVWIETHNTTTNAFGMINLVIGDGTRQGGVGTFSMIDWAEDLTIQVSVNTGSGYVVLGTSNFQSVPYAHYAVNGLSAAQSSKLVSLERGAEVNVQPDWEEMDPEADAFIKNKPDIPTDIAELTDTNARIPTDLNQLADSDGLLNGSGFSGSYDDLSGKPTIPSDISELSDENSLIPTDINELEDADGLLTGSTFDGSFNSLTDVPDKLDTDASNDFSGSYDDLSNKPMIPSDINDLDDEDGLLTGSTFDGSFNSLTDVPDNLDTDASDDFSGSYDDLTNTPTIPSDVNDLTDSNGLIPSDLDDLTDNSDLVPQDVSDLSDNSSLLFSGSFNDLTDVPTNLDTDNTDDFSGSYNDLTDTPTIPTDVNDLSDNSAIIPTDVNELADASDLLFSGSYDDLTNVPTDLATTADLVFGNTSNVISAGDSDDDFVFGSTQLDDANDTEKDTRFFFDKGNGAFRAGTAYGDRWDNANLGNNSFAAGVNGLASGTHSTVGGGYYNTASGLDASVGGGFRNYATGASSTIGGGSANRASGTNATVGGGAGNTAGGLNSTIPGGAGLETSSYGATVLGHYNAATGGSYDSQVATDPLFVIGNGADNSTLSDALVMTRDGNTTINGKLTLSDGTDPFTLPNTDGSSGQVLTTDGSGAVAWATPTDQGEFTSSSNVISAGDSDDDLVFGSTQLADDNSTADDDARIFFDKSKGAFRTGKATGNQWDDANVGSYSFAAGYDATASAYHSTVSGGSSNTASEQFSTIGGGSNNTASEMSSTVGGGAFNTASGYYSTVSGGGTNEASARLATIGGGVLNEASGNFSTIPGGKGLITSSYGATIIGHYNATIGGTANSQVATDPLFVIGNGSYGSESDALVMTRNGSTTLNGKLTLSDGTDPFTLPNADGASGQALVTDGNGAVTWSTLTDQGAFNNSTNVISTGDSNDDLVFGSDQLSDANDPDKDARLFFDKSKAAFRVGKTTGDQWNELNVGDHSFAAGSENKAVGDYSTVGGGYNNAVGDYYHTNSFNYGTGKGGTISGGFNNSVVGDYSTIGGGIGNTTGDNYYSSYTKYYGSGATIGGGKNNKAYGNYSTIPGGIGLQTHSYGATIIGHFNSMTGGYHDSTNPSDPLFVIGNGTSTSSRTNAFIVYRNGNAQLNGTLTQSSDRRLKKDLFEIEEPVLKKLSQLKAYRYRYNGIKMKDTTSVHTGVIAQELQTLFPELVKEGSDGYLSVSYTEMVPLLIEAIKELAEENEILRKEKISTETRLSSLESLMGRLVEQLPVNSTPVIDTE